MSGLAPAWYIIAQYSIERGDCSCRRHIIVELKTDNHLSPLPWDSGCLLLIFWGTNTSLSSHYTQHCWIVLHAGIYFFFRTYHAQYHVTTSRDRWHSLVPGTSDHHFIVIIGQSWFESEDGIALSGDKPLKRIIPGNPILGCHTASGINDSTPI